MVQRYTGAAEYLWWVPRIPNFVWLAMVILTVVALSISTLKRSWEQEEDARASFSYTQDRVEKARSENQEIRERTDRIRKDPRVAAQVAHDQLRLLRANEVVVAVR
ncbi:MAG: septum formation initiator family protein [Blastocatellia bacterium]|nr:septum formation initiator family protein [Blastocatellia bacterium]